MPSGMTTDYKKEALHTVALKFPATGRPMMFQTSYPPNTWRNMVSHAHRNANTVQAIFVMDTSEEGQQILQGTDPSDITPDFLIGLGEVRIREMAERYGVKYTAKSTIKSIALKIMAAIDDGVKPSPISAEAVSGE